MYTALYFYRAEVISVYDGDTCTASVDLGFNFKFEKLKLRLYGIDTPELRGDTKVEARAARDYLRSLVLNKPVVLESIRDKKGKYGRYLAKLWIEQDGQSICVNDLLVEQGYAVYADY